MAPSNSQDLAEFERLKRQLRVAVGALLLVTLIGVLGYALLGGEDHGLVDAIYMTVITLTTVGFGEIIDMSNSPAGRIFTVLLLLVGFAIVLYTVPMMTAFVIEGQLLNAFARRRMEKSISRMLDHYIVTGDAAAAGHVAGELVNTGRQVVLVIPGEASAGLRAAAGEEIPTIVGDPSDDSVLQRAGIERARGVVVCMESDKDNILTVLTARRLAPSARIVASTERPETEAKLRTAGVDAVVSPSRIGGLRMASELVRPTVVSFLDRMLRDERRGLRVEEVTATADSKADGRTLASLGVQDVNGALVLALRPAAADDYDFKPSPDTEVQAGMTIIVMADVAGRARLEEILK